MRFTAINTSIAIDSKRILKEMEKVQDNVSVNDQLGNISKPLLCDAFIGYERNTKIRN